MVAKSPHLETGRNSVATASPRARCFERVATATFHQTFRRHSLHACYEPRIVDP